MARTPAHRTSDGVRCPQFFNARPLEVRRPSPGPVYRPGSIFDRPRARSRPPEAENREKQVEEQSSKSVFDFEPLEVEEQIEQDPIDEEDWDVEPDDMWEEEESEDIEDLEEDVEEADPPQLAGDPGNTSDWSMDDGLSLIHI